MKKLNILGLAILIFTHAQALPINCPSGQVPITGFAQNFVTDARIGNATIKVLETGKFYKTDADGSFSFCEKIGQVMTLTLNKRGFHEVQSATYIVPTQGFQGPYNEITFQVPGGLTYQFMKFVISSLRKIKLDPNKCTVVTTITAYHKTLSDDPQGVPDAKISIHNINYSNITVDNLKPYYFGIIKFGPLKGKSNIFTSYLTKTSLDGGVLIYNLPAQTEKNLYVLSAIKANKEFTNIKVWCRAGALINVSPPDGPTVLQ